MIRPAYLAGQWYPGDEASCRGALDEHAAWQPAVEGDWRALIAPHAGWFYSGNAMGLGYQSLLKAQSAPELVVIFGSHRGSEGPNTIYRGEGWQTPLGDALIDREVVAALDADLSLLEEPPAPLRPDNAVEVHMPFIRHAFPGAKVVMLGVEASPFGITLGERVGDVCRKLARDTVFIGSTDLTHYGPNYGFSPHGTGEVAEAWVRDENDRGFLDALVAHDWPGAVDHALTQSSACCPGAAVAALAARQSFEPPPEGQAPRPVSHYLSSDVSSSPSFVGYGSLTY